MVIIRNHLLTNFCTRVHMVRNVNDFADLTESTMIDFDQVRFIVSLGHSFMKVLEFRCKSDFPVPDDCDNHVKSM